jgi:SNF2 family DNA or RNA helicase
MKWLIVPLESFSPRGLKNQKKVSFDDLPWAVRTFLSVFRDPFIVLDESSRVKTTTPMAEAKKSTRTRLIKLLNQFGERCIMTGTLMSKSPVNAYDQFEFLKSGFFQESMWEFAERYCVMETIVVNRSARRTLIREETYRSLRNSMRKAYIEGGESLLRATKQALYERHGINMARLEHILRHKKYAPFVSLPKLLERINGCSMTVRREDVMDTSFDKFVKEPIMRPVELTTKGKKIIKELVDVGFTDNFALGKSPDLELLCRIQDVCNGFEPVEADPDYDRLDAFDEKRKREILHRPLDENPKLEALIDLLEEIGTDENQVVVWSSRKLLLRACADRFEKEGYAYVKYDGDDSEESKAAAAAKFGSGEARIFLANQASAGYGLNCLEKSAYSIFVCVNDSVEQYYQAQHRILRGRLAAPKFSYHIYARGTAEERQLSRLGAGQELLTDSNSREVFDVA